MKSKTVWMISQYAGSKHHGMLFRDYYLAREFLKRGYETCIVAASFCHLRNKQPRACGQYTHEVIDGINYIWVNVPEYAKSRSLGRVLSMLIFFVKLFGLRVSKLPPPAAIMVNSLSPFPILIAHRWARRFKSRLLFEVVDIWPRTIVEIGNISRFHPFVLFMNFFEKYAYRKADYVVSVLPCAQEYMAENGMPRDNFVYIPNGTDCQVMHDGEPLGGAVLAKIPPHRFIVAYTGTIGIANVLEHFVRAASILKNRDIHFLLVGDGGERERLEEMAAGLGLQNITFLGSIHKSQIQSVLKLIDVCYVGIAKKPLFKLGVSPTKLFDYMLAGKPILWAIDAGNNIVADAGCGLSIEPENPGAIARGIMQLYNMDPAERAALGESGKRYVLEHHTYAKLADRFMELLH